MTFVPCDHCGSRVPVDAERCPSCGAAQLATAPAATVADPAVPAPRARSRGALAVVAMALAVLGLGLVVGVGAIVFLRSHGAPAKPAAGGGFAGVKARGALRVAADPDAAPFFSKTADGGYEGFEYGLMTALASDAGVPLTIVPASFEQLAAKVQGGDADLAIGQMSPSNAWAGLAWSVSYLQYSHCLIVPARSTVRTLADLRGKRIGMYDDPVATQLTAVGVGGDYSRVVFSDYGYFEKLLRGELDAVVYDCPLARHELKLFGNTLRIADDALNIATYSAAVPATDPALKTDVDRVFRSLGDQGLLARLETRWLEAPVPTAGYTTASGRVVVVRKGDTLAGIAARELGSADRWKELHDRNRDLIGDDPNVIYAGLRLRVGP